MDGLVLAASPSFLQTTCEETHSVSGGLAPNLPIGLTYLLSYLPEKNHLCPRGHGAGRKS